MKQIDGQIKVESFRVWREIGDAVTGAFSTAVKGVIMGTQTISQAMRNMAQSILLALIDMGVKWLAQQALNALIGAATEKAAAVAKVGANAAVAASGAAASVAAIPIYGWAMAPGVAAETYAATMAWAAAAASAAQGYDVPRGVNPMTQLHSEEMVLPADLANRVRGMTDTSPAPRVEIKYTPVGGDFWMVNRHEMARALGVLNRERNGRSGR
jgi:hypothetical protein